MGVAARRHKSLSSHFADRVLDTGLLSRMPAEIASSVRQARRYLKDRERTIRARIKRGRSRARFIVITGSSAKTTTTSLLTYILSSCFKVRAQIDENAFVNAVAAINALDGSEDFVVIETGSAGAGQLAEIMDLVKPDASIVTMVAIEHYSAFRNIEAIAQEKAEVVRALKADGLAILNHDDNRVRDMAALTPARSISFGSAGATYEVKEARVSPQGLLTVVLANGENVLTIPTQLVGAHNAVVVAAACSAALELGVPEKSIIERAATFGPVPGRMDRHAIPGGPVFIVDSRKAPYYSIGLPIETLRTMEAPRKRFVLGQISDYSGNPRKKYRDTYLAARTVADEVIFVGPYAHRSGATPEDIANNRFRSFSRVEEAAAYLRTTAIENEVIMVKSSRNLHLERLLLSWLSDVRCWADACGVKTTCWKCGLHRHPFTEHSGNPKRYKAKKPRLRRLMERIPFLDAR